MCDGIARKKHNLKLVLGNIYRPPRDLNDNYIHFFNEIRPIRKTLDTYKHDIIVAGDYDIDFFKINEKIFSEFYLASGISPTYLFYTLFSKKSATSMEINLSYKMQR